MIDEVSMRLSCRGGEAGGVAGSPPGEHIGMCLLGIAVGTPREEVLSDRCGGGVDVRCGMGTEALATAAVILAVGKLERGHEHSVIGTGQVPHDSDGEVRLVALPNKHGPSSRSRELEWLRVQCARWHTKHGK